MMVLLLSICYINIIIKDNEILYIYLTINCTILNTLILIILTRHLKIIFIIMYL